jgi:hypothetical protein
MRSLTDLCTLAVRGLGADWPDVLAEHAILERHGVEELGVEAGR